MGVKAGSVETALLPLLYVSPPILLYFWYIHHFGVNVMVGDEWFLVPTIHKFFTGSLSFSDLWVQGNEHRPVVPVLLTLFLGQATHFNTKVAMYFSAMLLTASLLLLYFLYRRHESRSSLLFLPIPYVIFSLSQYENTLSGLGIGWYVVLFLLLGALLALEYSESASPLAGRALFVALSAALTASFSLFQGLFTWPCGLLYLTGKRAPNIFKLVWCFSGILACMLYFFRFDFQNTGGPPLSSFITHPLADAMYFSVALGHVIPSRPDRGFFEASVIGLLIFAFSIYFVATWIRDQKYSRLALLTSSILLFGFLFDISLIVGRSGFGVAQAASSRYTTYNLLFLVGIYLGLISLVEAAKGTQRRVRQVVMGIFCTLLVVQVAASFQEGLAAGERMKIRGIEAADILANYHSAPDNLVRDYLYWDPQSLRQRASIAEAHRLSVFSEPVVKTYLEGGIVPGGVPVKALPAPPVLQSLYARNKSAAKAWIVLSSLYRQREDLRIAFPLDSKDFPRSLLSWSVTSGMTVDGARDFLIPYKAELSAMYRLVSGAASW